MKARRTLLLVEDEIPYRDVVKRLLQQQADHEYGFLEASSVQAGLDLYVKAQPDCVLLDYKFPVENGLTFLKKLEETDVNPPHPVVMLTGHGDENVAAEAIKLGAQDYLAKLDSSASALHRAINNATERVQAQRLLTVQQDELTRMAEALRKSEAQYRTLVETVNEVIYRTDADGVFTYANAMVLNLTGYSQQEILQKHYLDLVHPDYRKYAFFFYEDQIRRCVSNTYYEYPAHTTTGQEVWLGQNVQLVYENGVLHGLQAVARDVTKQRRAEERIRFQARVLEHINEAVIVFDRTGSITYVNSGAEELIGFSKKEILKTHHSTAFQYRWLNSMTKREALKILLQLGLWEGEVAYMHPGGIELIFEISCSLIHGDHNNVVGILSVFRDVTDRKRMEESLIYNAYHDALTGLPNRQHFLFRIWDAITLQVENPQAEYAVLYFDLDRFKVINDSLGHHLGDELLRKFAQRIGQSLNEEDLLGRLGGDEFGILLPKISTKEEPTQVAGKIIKSLETPFRINDHDIIIEASIGVVYGHADYARPEDLLRDADVAMYWAKRSIGASYKVFTPFMTQQSEATFKLEHKLRRGIDQDELRAFYQPIVTLDSGRLLGFEALVRWQHPEDGLLEPPSFISLAEETGLILQIDRWMLSAACRQIHEWNEKFGADLGLTVNVNCTHLAFMDTSFVRYIGQLVEKYNLLPYQLGLEITESVLIEDTVLSVSELISLREQQVRVCIDDFGTGYSSLSLLHQLPMDTLKIDRSFVSRIAGSSGVRPIVETIIDLAHNLQLNVIAEGIETKKQLQALLTLGCEQGQGYLFSKPVPTEEATMLIRRQMVENKIAGHHASHRESIKKG